MGKLTEKEMGFAGFCDGEIFQPQSWWEENAFSLGLYAEWMYLQRKSYSSKISFKIRYFTFLCSSMGVFSNKTT